MYDLILSRKESKKGNDYFNLAIDLGYRKQSLTFDTAIIVAVLGISEKDLYEQVAKDSANVVGKIQLGGK